MQENKEIYKIKHLLRDLYYDTKTGFKTQKRLYVEAKKLNPYITYADINNFLEKQEEYQMSRKQKPQKNLLYNISAPRGYYQADLMFYKNLTKVPANKNNDTILCMVEIATRKGYAIAMNGKESITVLEKLKKILEKIHEPVKAITTDNGSEFKSVFNHYLEEHHIKHYWVQPKDHNSMSIVERFNRTIKKFNNRYFLATKRYNWVSILDDVVYNYNHSHNNNIGGTPYDLTDEQVDIMRSNDIQHNMDVRERIMKRIKVGDSVRTRLLLDEDKKDNAFEKEGQIWSDKVHQVVAPNKNKFEISGLTRKYAINDLQVLRSSKIKKAPPLVFPFAQTAESETDELAATHYIQQYKTERAIKKDGLNALDITTAKRSRVPVGFKIDYKR